MSKRKKKQKMERQRYIVLYVENFWSFGIVIYKFVNWVLGVCDYRQRKDQGLVGIDQFDSLFVCSTQKSEKVHTAKKTKQETENNVFFCTTQNMGEFLVLRWMAVDVVSCKSISIRKCYFILFYYPKKLLYQLYHTILQYFQQPKLLFSYFTH